MNLKTAYEMVINDVSAFDNKSPALSILQAGLDVVEQSNDIDYNDAEHTLLHSVVNTIEHVQSVEIGIMYGGSGIDTDMIKCIEVLKSCVDAITDGIDNK